MYKLIVSDMDGTLLNSIGEISSENLNAINKAIHSGVEFAIVTGRPYISVKKILNDNSLSCYVIGCNGAQVTDKSGKLLKAHYMKKESLIKLMNTAEESHLYYQVYDDYFIYTNSRLKLAEMLMKIGGKSVKKYITPKKILDGLKRLFFTEVKVLKNLNDFVENSSNGFYKILIYSNDISILNNIKEKAKDIPGIYITSSYPTNLEIIAEGISKGAALKELAESKNIRQSEVIAMGDNYNDISMIEYAGCGVAVENAESAVKEAADFKTKSNNDNGVAYAIEKLIFNK